MKGNEFPHLPSWYHKKNLIYKVSKQKYLLKYLIVDIDFKLLQTFKNRAKFSNCCPVGDED